MGPSEWTGRPFEVSHRSDLLLMDSVFQVDGVLKIQPLTNDNRSDLLRGSLYILLSQPPLLANYMTGLEVGFRESILPFPRHK